MAILASNSSLLSFAPGLGGGGGGSCFSFGLDGGSGGSAGREEGAVVLVGVDDDNDCFEEGLGGIDGCEDFRGILGLDCLEEGEGDEDDDDDKFPFLRSFQQVIHPQQHIINTPAPTNAAIQISTVCHHHKGAMSFILITCWSPKSACTLYDLPSNSALYSQASNPLKPVRTPRYRYSPTLK